MSTSHPDIMTTAGESQDQGQDHPDQQQNQDEAAPKPTTLAEILAARTRKLDRERREAEDLAQRKLEGQRQDQHTAFTVRYEQTFPQALRDALNATIGYDTTTEGYDDERAERGPFATFEHDGAPWIIRHAYHYGAIHWSLEGPNEYHADLGYDDDYSSPTGPLLDALNEYPSWLHAKIAREHEKAERAAAQGQTVIEERNREQERPLYAYVAGDDAGHYGLLNCGSKVWLKVETPETGEYGERTETHRAGIVDWDDHWLLINLDDDETQQRLIPITRVVSIHVRA